MRTSLNIPQEAVELFDKTWKAEGLESRSRAVREAIHEYIERHTRLEQIDGDVVAAVAFDYEHTLIIGELHTVQHEFEEIIQTTHHMHHGEWSLRRFSVREQRLESATSSTSSVTSMPLVV
jgi:CopG family nickel-responsive transcriptional regulator